MPRRVPENAKLLFGPYSPPPLKKGDRATCLYRDADVVITSWSDSRISWPRCRAIGHRGGSGLLVDDELARAVRNESAAALMYWWGITGSTAARWRTALGVLGLTGTEGTRRLVRAGQVRRVAKLRAKRPPPEQAQRPAARQLDRIRGLQAVNRECAWPAEHLALLGILNRRRGRGPHRPLRERREGQAEQAGHPQPVRPGWTAEELDLLGTMPDAEVAAWIGRTKGR
jgi:hypothetical protein